MLGAAAGFVGVLAAFAVLRGASLERVVHLAAFLSAWVIVPGIAIRRLLRANAGDVPAELAFSALYGIATSSVAFFALRSAHATEWIVAWPLVLVPLAALDRRRRRRETTVGVAPSTRDRGEAARGWLTVVFLVTVTALLVRTRDVADPWSGVDVDTWFHVGNAAEMLRDAPTMDPRVAGLRLNYHEFAYALPATFAGVFRVSAFEAVTSMLAAFVPCVLVLLVYAAGVRLGRTAAAGLVAASVLFFHGDLARILSLLDAPFAFRFTSGAWAATSLFASPTGTLAVATGVGLGCAVHEHLERPESRRGWIAVALLAFVASGARGSTMPVVLVALAAIVVGARWRGRTVPGLTSVFVIAVLAAAPMTVALVVGAGSYAGAMVRVEPLASVAASGVAVGLFGREVTMVERVGALLPWFLAYAGVPFVIASTWVFVRQKAWRGAFVACAVASSLPLLVLVAPARSQAFFAHTGEVAVCAVAGAALAGQSRWRGRAAAWAWTGFALTAFVGVIACARRVSVVNGAGASPPERYAPWHTGMEWLRTRTDRECLVVARHPHALVSALAERRSLFEDARFTPEAHAAGGVERADFPQRDVARAILESPVDDVLARVSSFAPRAREFYVVLDSVAEGPASRHGPNLIFGSRGVSTAVETNPRFTLVFRNDAMAIWRADLSGDT